eukprot:UN16926
MPVFHVLMKFFWRNWIKRYYARCCGRNSFQFNILHVRLYNIVFILLSVLTKEKFPRTNGFSLNQSQKEIRAIFSHNKFLNLCKR